MSDLQISLLGIGLVIVAGVYGYNVWQDRKYHEDSPEDESENALLEENAPAKPSKAAKLAAKLGKKSANARIEPALSGGAAVPETAARSVAAKRVAPETLLEMFPAIEYSVDMHSDVGIPANYIADVLDQTNQIGKPVRWYGFNPEAQMWESISPQADVNYYQLRAALQLVDRNGAVSDFQLQQFCELLQEVANAWAAGISFPSQAAARARAVELDNFCADVDVMIGLNIISQGSIPFAGFKLLKITEKLALVLGDDGTYRKLDFQGNTLFLLANSEGAPFVADKDKMKTLTTHSLTLLFDVPKVQDGLKAFEQMAKVAAEIAQGLEGVLVDDNRRPLNEAAVQAILQQLRELYTKMEDADIPPGSPLAKRLFS